MKVLGAAVVVALLAGPVYGQTPEHMQGYREEAQPKSPVQIEADKAAERAYKESLGNIPDRGPVDPWGNARAVGAPKDTAKNTGKAATRSAAKTAPAKPKTVSTSN
jgi:hypothetical protein